MNNKRLRSMLEASATADRERALLSLELLSDHPAGIGDHSTKDFYVNAEEALALLADADDRLEMLAKYFPCGSAGVNGIRDHRSKSTVEGITR